VATRKLKKIVWRSVAVAGVFGFVLLAAGAPLYFSGHCVPSEKISQLRWDMSRAQIIELLGPPSSAGSYPDGYSRISYRRINVWCSLDIYINSDGKITRMFHDH
jgi:outer membrane protein assembly factor BamE (lipoprotein component of BamABCDE complex)